MRVWPGSTSFEEGGHQLAVDSRTVIPYRLTPHTDMKTILIPLLMSLTLGMSPSQTEMEFDRVTKVTVTMKGEVLAVVNVPPGSVVSFFGEYVEEKQNQDNGSVATKLTGIDGMKLVKDNSELVSIAASKATAFLETVELP